MFKALRKPQTIAIIGVILLALVVVPSAHSSPSGISYQTVKDQGCYCHSADASAEDVSHADYLDDEDEDIEVEEADTGG